MSTGSGARKRIGQQIGPTGRKRDEFEVFAWGYKRKGYKQETLNKPYRGNAGYHAYGQVGVKEVKRGVHRKFPHKWVKFDVENESRLRRIVAKRTKGTKGIFDKGYKGIKHEHS